MTAKRDDDEGAAATAAAHSPTHEKATRFAFGILLCDPDWTSLRLGLAFDPDGVRWQQPAHAVRRGRTS